MKKAALIIAASIAIICVTALIFWGYIGQKEETELMLSDYPKLFEKEVVIVIGENATQMEYESAEVIAENLYNSTGNMPVIRSDIYLTEGDKAKYNLILVGTPRTNRVLKEVYELTDATRVTEEYPGENKGILEILRNPWNEKKAMLLVEGSDEWGVKAGSEILEEAKEDKSSVIVKWKDSKANIIKFDFLPYPYGLNNSEAVKFALSKKCGEDWNKKYQIGSYYEHPSISFDHKLIRIAPPDFCILVTTEKVYFLSMEEFNEFLELYGNEYVQTEVEVIDAFSLYLKLYGLYDESIITPYYREQRWALILEEQCDRNFTDLSNTSIEKRDDLWQLECHTISQFATYPHTKPSPIDIVIARYIAEVGVNGNINILKTESERYEELIPAGPR